MEFNIGELATIYRQVHKINKRKLQSIKHMDELINFNIVPPTHQGKYRPKYDPLFFNVEGASMLAIDTLISAYK